MTLSSCEDVCPPRELKVSLFTKTTQSQRQSLSLFDLDSLSLFIGWLVGDSTSKISFRHS